VSPNTYMRFKIANNIVVILQSLRCHRRESEWT